MFIYKTVLWFKKQILYKYTRHNRCVNKAFYSLLQRRVTPLKVSNRGARSLQIIKKSYIGLGSYVNRNINSFIPDYQKAPFLMNQQI